MVEVEQGWEEKPQGMGNTEKPDGLHGQMPLGQRDGHFGNAGCGLLSHFIIDNPVSPLCYL